MDSTLSPLFKKKIPHLPFVVGGGGRYIEIQNLKGRRLTLFKFANGNMLLVGWRLVFSLFFKLKI